MKIDTFYEPIAVDRLKATLLQLARHDLSHWVLTGGTAIELHLRKRKAPTQVRQLHDLDFFAASFACLPETLGGTLLLRHVHPNDPPAKCMLQAVDPITAVRIDVFRAYGAEVDRASDIRLNGFRLQMVAFEDLTARHARLCCALLRGQPLAPKYARDFLRMVDLVQSDRIEPVWQEHRQTEEPLTFAQTSYLLRGAIASRSELLVPPAYSTDLGAVCPRCQSTAAFELASSQQIFSLLGYC